MPAAAAIHVAGLAIIAALYADDLLLLAPTPTYLQASMDQLLLFCSESGLRVSGSKTVVMHVNCEGAIHIQDATIAKVQQAKYLGLI